MKIGRKYFEIEEEEVKVGGVGDVGDDGGDGGGAGDGDTGSGDAEEGSAEGVEEKSEIEPLEDAVVNEVKTTKRGRKTKGAE